MRFLAFLLFGFFLLFAVFCRWYFVCELLGLCQPVEVPVVVEDTRMKTLQLVQEDSVLLDGYEEFSFPTQSFTPTLNANNGVFLDSVAAMLRRDTTLLLAITGRYTAKDEGVLPGFFDNMGLARADAVRKLLVQRGIAERRINPEYELVTDTLLQQPVAFRLRLPKPDDYGVELYTFTNMSYSDLNFEVDSYELKPGEGFKRYADSVYQYLAMHPQQQLRIVGHTDDTASDKYNYRLGMNRAKSTQAYFKELGVENPIEIESEGERSPIRPNNSDENRRKNRRVNIIIE